MLCLDLDSGLKHPYKPPTTKDYIIVPLLGSLISLYGMFTDVLSADVKAVSLPSTLIELRVQTRGRLPVLIYGELMKLSPLITGATYMLHNIEMSVTRPYVGWMSHLCDAVLLSVNMDSIAR